MSETLEILTSTKNGSKCEAPMTCTKYHPVYSRHESVEIRPTKALQMLRALQHSPSAFGFGRYTVFLG